MKDLKTNLLRYHQREQLKSDVANAEMMLPHAKAEDRGVLLSNIKRTKRQLDAQSPEPLTGKEKDTLNALEKKLRSRITTNMPPEEVMRKNPAGAVDWAAKWEKSNKSLIRMWKNIKIQLNPDSSDRDLANIERYRPSGQMDRLRGDAQIPGVMSYHNIPEEQWPFEPPTNTAAEQAKRRYEDHDAESEVNQALDDFDKAEEVVEEDETVDKRKGEPSPERKAILQQRLANAREILAKQRAEQKQLDETLEAVPVKVD